VRARGSAEHSDVRRKDTMTTADLDALVLRANRAGHNSIAEYALALERALSIVGSYAVASVRVTREVLDGKEA